MWPLNDNRALYACGHCLTLFAGLPGATVKSPCHGAAPELVAPTPGHLLLKWYDTAVADIKRRRERVREANDRRLRG